MKIKFLPHLMKLLSHFLFCHISKFNTPSVPKYKVLEGSNFVPKYKILEGYEKIE
jgi:hypothetical protein